MLLDNKTKSILIKENYKTYLKACRSVCGFRNICYILADFIDRMPEKPKDSNGLSSLEQFFEDVIVLSNRICFLIFLCIS